MSRPMRRLIPGQIVGLTEIVEQRGKAFLVRCLLCGQTRVLMKTTAWKGSRCLQCYRNDPEAKARRDRWCYRRKP